MSTPLIERAWKALHSLRGARVFQCVTKGDSARTWFITSPRDEGVVLHNAFWFEVIDSRSGHELTDEQHQNVREFICAASPESVITEIATALARAAQIAESEGHMEIGERIRAEIPKMPIDLGWRAAADSREDRS